MILNRPASSADDEQRIRVESNHKPVLGIVGGSRRTVAPTAMQEAKALFFAEWDQLESLCERRFPNDDNLAYAGMNYIVQRLQSDDWQRLRAWQGQGRLSTYLLTLAARLLTDYSRVQSGQIRMLAWMGEQSDPVWQQAYRLIIVKGYNRRDAVSWLTTYTVGRETGFIENVVAELLSNCSHSHRDGLKCGSLDDVLEPACADSAPEAEMHIKGDEFLEGLRRLLTMPDERIENLVERLRPHLKLSDEDRLLLRLHHIDGIKMRDIERLLQLSRDPCRQHHKVIAAVRAALHTAGSIVLHTQDATGLEISRPMNDAPTLGADADSLAQLALLASDNGKVSPCPPTEQLSAFIDGELDTEAHPAVLVHLDHCSECRKHWREVSDIACDPESRPAAVPRATTASRASGIRQRKRQRLLPWALASLVCAAAALSLVLLPSTQPVGKRTDAQFAADASSDPAISAAAQTMPLRWDTAGLGLGVSVPDPATRAFGAGIWQARSTLIGDQTQLTDTLSPAALLDAADRP